MSDRSKKLIPALPADDAQSKAGNYWNSSSPFSEVWSGLWFYLVPRKGEADDEVGEVMRLVSRLYYDLYNNGGANFSYDEHLVKYVHKFIGLVEVGLDDGRDVRGIDPIDWDRVSRALKEHTKRTCYRITVPRNSALYTAAFDRVIDALCKWAYRWVIEEHPEWFAESPENDPYIQTWLRNYPAAQQAQRAGEES